MKVISSVLIVIAALTVNAAAQVLPSGDVLAKVGNHEITREMLDNIITTIPEENRVPFLTPDGRKKILDEVLSFTLFADAATQAGIDREPAVRTRLEYEQTQYLAREYFARRMAKAPQVSREECKTYFDAHVSEFKPPEEIIARHIVVGTEAEANKIVDQINGGADFADLAKKHSIDPAGPRGGKLEMPDGREWLPKGSFEKGFEHTLFGLAKGKVAGPVKSQFGWHILKVEDRKQPDTPSFEQVFPFIRNRLQEERTTQLRSQITEELKKGIPVVIK